MKYKVGDRVRIVGHRVLGMNLDGDMDKWLCKVMTIKAVQGRSYAMVEDQGEYCGHGWFWDDDMIAGLAEKVPEPWTEEEIEKARGIVAYLADDIVYNGGDLSFIPVNKNDTSVSVFPDFPPLQERKSGIARLYSKDCYNPWIGKCVALCKALDRPVPDFIMNKNRSDE